HHSPAALPRSLSETGGADPRHDFILLPAWRRFLVGFSERAGGLPQRAGQLSESGCFLFDRGGPVKSCRGTRGYPMNWRNLAACALFLSLTAAGCGESQPNFQAEAPPPLKL